MNLSAPSFPDRITPLALGSVLHAWSQRFKPVLLDTASSALHQVQRSISTLADQLESLEVQLALEPFPTDIQKAEQVRLAQLLNSQVATLERLGKLHSTLTAVSTAALVHSFTRPNAHDAHREAAPSRRIGSGVGVIDV